MKLILSSKNLSIIDQDQVIYLNINKQWLSVESQKDFIEGGGKYNKTDFYHYRFYGFFNVFITK